MVAYSFKSRFVEPIVLGTKRQTIRAARTGRSRHAYPGERLQLYTGLRTRHSRLILEATCTEVMDIAIRFQGDGIAGITVAGHPVRDLGGFARRDGFDDLRDMAQFWRDKHGTEDLFTGVVIEWTRVLTARRAAA